MVNIMSFAVRELAEKYSKHYLDRLRNILLDKSTHSLTHGEAEVADFELDLEVTFDHRKKVEEVHFK